VKVATNWEFSSEYLLTASKVLRFPANRILEGLMVPQIPRNQANFQVTYFNRSWTLGVQGRAVGKQFDDDQNTLPLKRFFTLDGQVSRTITPKLQLFVAIQNITGVRAEVSKTPVVTLGPPILIRVGTRFTYH
jgi:outer membrane receptor protein involved in Fe transport